MEQRFRFIVRNKLPPDFAFAAYLAQCKRHVFLKLAEIPVTLWLVFGVLRACAARLRQAVE
jgi:hypothetical protein